MLSQKYELNKNDFLAITRQITIIYSPVIILFLEQIESWTLDIKIIIALIISTTIDIIRRFLKDYRDEIYNIWNN